MFKIANLSKKYKNNDRYSVKDLSLEIKDGEIFGFLGPNGAGKSTTIKSVVGILPYGKFADLEKQGKKIKELNPEGKKVKKQKLSLEERSSISIDGIEFNDNPKLYKSKIAYVSDNHAVFERLTGLEYVHHIANLYGVSEQDRQAVIEKYGKLFNLAHAINKPISSYSHGMKQKINVIAALVHNPKLWVLDEPLLGLDPVSAYELKNAMREHANNGNMVFFSSHMIDVVYAICDKVGIIVNGVLQDVYSVKDLKQKNIDLEKIFIEIINKNAAEKLAEASLEQNLEKVKETKKVKDNADLKETKKETKLDAKNKSSKKTTKK